MFVVKSESGKFLAGEHMDDEGHISPVWSDAQSDRTVLTFARKDAAKRAAEFFGGEVVKEA